MRCEHSEIFERWIPAYERVGHRDRAVWRWCWVSFEQTTLACVPAALREQVQAIKMIAVIWNAMLDDLADELGDARVLEAAIEAGSRTLDRAVTTGVPPALRAYVELVAALRRELELRARSLPGHDACASLLRFDLHNVMQSFRWGLIANRHAEWLDWDEYERHQPHNFMMQYAATLDLAAAPALAPGERAAVRRLSWWASCCGNLANSLTTWERELHARDLSSAVAQIAVRSGAVPASADLAIDELVARVRRSGAVEQVEARWAACMARCEAAARELTSFDAGAYVAGTRQLLASQVALARAVGTGTRHPASARSTGT